MRRLGQFSGSLIFWFVLSLLSSSCQPKEEEILAGDQCVSSSTLVREVSQETGVIYYDSTQARYGIQVPTSMDSADMGLTCNLPAAYQRPLKKVRFWGRYYQPTTPKTGPIGYRYYDLIITRISSL